MAPLFKNAPIYYIKEIKARASLKTHHQTIVIIPACLKRQSSHILFSCGFPGPNHRVTSFVDDGGHEQVF
jgi:hypothetical protein